jgi:hypothetical protein
MGVADMILSIEVADWKEASTSSKKPILSAIGLMAYPKLYGYASSIISTFCCGLDR